MNSFLEELNELATQAVQSKIEAQARLDAELAKRIEKEKERAVTFTDKVMDLARQAAASARNEATVMKLTAGSKEGLSDYWERNTVNRDLRKEQLGICAKTVYEYCRDLGLAVKVRYWHDGVGMNSGYEMVVSGWAPQATSREIR